MCFRMKVLTKQNYLSFCSYTVTLNLTRYWRRNSTDDGKDFVILDNESIHLLGSFCFTCPIPMCRFYVKFVR